MARTDTTPGQHNSELDKQAKTVLDFNWTGEYTRPGPRLYPHQWSWDSALVAIGYARYDLGRAVRELSHLFGAQWKNGLLPQIVFTPGLSEYFPNAGFWHADESPDATRHAKTSGIVQPPLHATAALHVYRQTGGSGEGRTFLESAFDHRRATPAQTRNRERPQAAPPYNLPGNMRSSQTLISGPHTRTRNRPIVETPRRGVSSTNRVTSTQRGTDQPQTDARRSPPFIAGRESPRALRR